MIFESAQRSRGEYTATADIVSKLGILVKDAFGSNKEMVYFAEQLNKQFIVGGASAIEQKSAMYQLTQAMSSGRLQGDEFRSVMENAPMLAQAIAKYMNMSVGELRKVSSQGIITADIIKKALFSVADETDEKFKQMPMTWAQVWQSAANTLYMAFQPILNIIGSAATWIYNSWSTVAPVFYGVAAAALVLAAALGIQTIATWIATGAAQAFFITLLTNPLTYIVLIIGLVVMAIYKWVQSVGGLHVAWLIVANVLLTTWDLIKMAFFVGVYRVLDLWDKMELKILSVAINIANHIGDMKVSVLTTLQNMVNGAVDIINNFIGVLNKTHLVSLDLIDHVTFGTEAAAQNEAEKSARTASLTSFQRQIEINAADRHNKLFEMGVAARTAMDARQAGIDAATAVAQNQAAQNQDIGSGILYNQGPGSGVQTSLNNIDNNTKNSNAISEENLKYLRDIAERDAINKFTTANIHIDMSGMNNTVNHPMDLDGVVNHITEGVRTQMYAVAAGVH